MVLFVSSACGARSELATSDTGCSDTIVASELGGALDVASFGDDDVVFWTRGSLIERHDATSNTILVDVGQNVVLYIAVDASRVYYAATGGDVMSVGRDGGAPVLLASDMAGPLALAGDALLVLHQHAVLTRIDPDKSLHDIWTSSVSVSALAADGEFAYVGLATGLVRIDVRTGVSTLLADDPYPRPIVDETSVYYVSDSAPSVMAVSKDGSAPKRALFDLHGLYGVRLHADRDGVYITTFGYRPAEVSELWRVAPDGTPTLVSNVPGLESSDAYAFNDVTSTSSAIYATVVAPVSNTVSGEPSLRRFCKR